MTTSDWLTLLNVLVAFLGVFIVGYTIFEFRKLSALRQGLETFEARIQAQIYAALKASHRVLASYAVKDAGQRIALLSSALQIDRAVFNGFNALGYAYLEKNEPLKAADAFKDAIHQHPDDVAGYFDLAHAYLVIGDRDLALAQLRRAVKIDPSARGDIADNPLLPGIHPEDV